MERGRPRYRLVATDLDGTIVRSDGTISARTRDALELVERSGALVVFVTGRPPRWMKPIAEQTGHRGLAICCNGAVVYDLHSEQVLQERPLQPAVLTQVMDALIGRVEGVTFAVEYGEGFAREAAYPTRPGSRADVPVTDRRGLADRPAVKLLARHPSLGPDELLAVAREVVGEAATCVHSSGDGLLEISAPGVTKASALASFALERGIDAADVVAFGDMPNDLPLLAWAGRSIAVANAHPDVLAASDDVTAANDEDGVAQYLEGVFG